MKLAVNTPSIVSGLTFSASNVLASAPTDPASQVNFLVSDNSSAAFNIATVASPVPNKTTTGLPGTAEIALRIVFPVARSIPPCG